MSVSYCNGRSGRCAPQTEVDMIWVIGYFHPITHDVSVALSSSASLPSRSLQLLSIFFGGPFAISTPEVLLLSIILLQGWYPKQGNL